MRSPLVVSALVFLCFVCGCQSMQQQTAANTSADAKETPEKQGPNLQTRNNALALLDDLLNDEKNVSKILIVKHNSDELGRLVKDISRVAADDAKMLEAFAKTVPGLNLKQFDLPPGEFATRRAISKSKEQILLHSKDAEFQFQLLL